MKEKLKKCPFCGCEYVRIVKAEYPRWSIGEWYLECGECTAMGGQMRTKAEAIKAWNRRVSDVRK